MDDKTCRLEILRIFKEFRDQHPNDTISRKERFTDSLKIDEKEVDGNVRYLTDKGLLDVKWLGNKFQGRITAEGIDFLETGEPANLAILSPTIHQEFHGPVGQVVGRDINITITLSDILNKLTETAESDEEIPANEKRSLIEKFKGLAQNDWVRSVGTSVVADMIKSSLGIK
jgi:hypothetical protein